jgi:hypothetical protein
MARINIDESLFTDPRFISLCVLLKSEIKAIGWWVKVARLAQTYWKLDKQLIPFDAYEFAKFPKKLLDSGIVEKRESGYYLRGSEENFAWIYQKVISGRKSHGGGRPLKSLENKQRQNNGKTTAKQPLTPTLTPTPTHKEEVYICDNKKLTEEDCINIENLIAEKYLTKLLISFDKRYITQEIPKIKAWLIGNPDKRKTKKGLVAFLTNWLNRGYDNWKLMHHDTIVRDAAFKEHAEWEKREAKKWRGNFKISKEREAEMLAELDKEELENE